MAAHNNNWFKEDLVIRIWGVIIWLLGLAIYLMFFIFSCIGSRDLIKTFSLLNAIGFFIKNMLLFPGLIPLIIGGFFLVLFRKSQDFFIGAFVILPAFIFLHYIVAAVSAHDDGWRYLGFQLFEILCAVVVIVKYQRKWQRLAAQ